MEISSFSNILVRFFTAKVKTEKGKFLGTKSDVIKTKKASKKSLEIQRLRAEKKLKKIQQEKEREIIKITEKSEIFEDKKLEVLEEAVTAIEEFENINKREKELKSKAEKLIEALKKEEESVPGKEVGSVGFKEIKIRILSRGIENTLKELKDILEIKEKKESIKKEKVEILEDINEKLTELYKGVSEIDKKEEDLKREIKDIEEKIKEIEAEKNKKAAKKAAKKAKKVAEKAAKKVKKTAKKATKKVKKDLKKKGVNPEVYYIKNLFEGLYGKSIAPSPLFLSKIPLSPPSPVAYAAKAAICGG